MENYIDNYFLTTRNKSKDINISNFCFDLTKFSKELNDSIDYSFQITFNIDNMSKKYYISLKQMKNFITLFRFDKYGIKKLGYTFIDKIKPKNTFQFKSISYDLDDYENYDFLNINKSTWYFPVDKNIYSNKNFLELYDDALTKATFIINEINDYFFKDKKINIKKLFNNESYVTGINCLSKKKQKFFEF